jgi:uncharacterized protein YdcH (DUF465 family)
MSLEKHDLIHELPEYKEAIHLLKTNSAHFAKLFDEYHELDHEDQLFSMIREYEASTAS